MPDLGFFWERLLSCGAPNRAMMPRALVRSATLVLVCAGVPAQDRAPQTGVQDRLAAFAEADLEPGAAAARRRTFKALLAEPAVRERLAAVIDERLAKLQRRYAALLIRPVRAAYRDHFVRLGAQAAEQVARTRRVWRTYILHTTTQFEFQRYFLKPAIDVGRLLVPAVEPLATKDSKACRKLLDEYDGYRSRVREALGLGEDPTTGVVASTGVPFPELTRIRNWDEHIAHLHRSIALASSVAPRGARDILIENAIKARSIDFEEAEFVLLANEVRMLMGTVAWSIDLAACACTRDHSHDRTLGKAKGHWSSIPGKKGMGDRLRRFGTSARSEGAGGGRNGRGYLHGLSYGGGHTGPLYSLKRNVVGVGRRGNTYTSVYRGDQRLKHACHATENEMFMPPGFARENLTAPDLIAVYDALQGQRYEKAAALVADAKTSSKFDRAMLRWFTTVLRVEADWAIECLARVEAAGDAHGVQTRIEAARALFGTTLDRRLGPFEKRLRRKKAARVAAAGRAYAEACGSGDAAVREFLAAHPRSIYAEAARATLSAKKREGAHPLQWFLTKDRYLNRFDYLR